MDPDQPITPVYRPATHRIDIVQEELRSLHWELTRLRLLLLSLLGIWALVSAVWLGRWLLALLH